MRILLLSLVCLIGFGLTSFSQEIVSAEYIGSKTKEDIGAELGLEVFQFDVEYYRIKYTSTDAKEQDDILSGLMVLPQPANNTYPIAFYEHGTSSCKTCVPSRYESDGGSGEGDEGLAGLVFSSMGYITLVPDYVGMGDGNGFQTYVHAATSVSATEDLLTAFKAWAPENEVLFNDQLFITGYSQGGYASMAFHKAMQEKYGAEFITAAAHNSGPYSLGGVMRDLILNDTIYDYPAYIPNTMLGMREAYYELDLYQDLNDFFKPAYASLIQVYYDGTKNLIDLNAELFDLLAEENEGEAIANRMIRDDILSSIANDPDFIVNQMLNDNDLTSWVPQSPTRIFYCKGDDQVPYKNAVVAIDSMYSLGADQNLVKAENLNDTFDHSECVQPAFLRTLLFFGTYRDITLNTQELTMDEINVYPNPVDDKLFISGNIGNEGDISIFDLKGSKKIISKKDYTDGIDVSSLEKGMYIVQITLGDGQTVYKKIIVQ